MGIDPNNLPPGIQRARLREPALRTPGSAASPAPAPVAPRLKKPRRAKEPNSTEREYEAMLRAQYPEAQIRWEAYTLRLAAGCRYSPDYSVAHKDGTVDMHEVKGAFIFSKALTKPKAAAFQFPQHRFFLAQKKKSGWEITQLSNV